MDKVSKKKNTEYLQKVMAYKKVFSSEYGVKVLDDLMVAHGVLMVRPGNMSNPHELFFHEGERNVVLRILKMMEMDPEKLRQRIKEIEKHDDTDE